MVNELQVCQGRPTQIHIRSTAVPSIPTTAFLPCEPIWRIFELLNGIILAPRSRGSEITLQRALRVCVRILLSLDQSDLLLIIVNSSRGARVPTFHTFRTWLCEVC